MQRDPGPRVQSGLPPGPRVTSDIAPTRSDEPRIAEQSSSDSFIIRYTVLYRNILNKIARDLVSN